MGTGGQGGMPALPPSKHINGASACFSSLSNILILWFLGILGCKTLLSMPQFMDAETDCGEALGLGQAQCQIVSRLFLLPADSHLQFWLFHTQIVRSQRSREETAASNI